MADAGLTLDQYLGDCYGAKFGLRPAGAIERLTVALASDPALKTEAEARLAQLVELEASVTEIGKRCAVSKAHLDALRTALSG